MEEKEKGPLCIGIAYNTFRDLPRYRNERSSEIAIETGAREVFQAVASLGYSSVFLPLNEDLVKFLKWLDETKPDAIANLCEGYQGIPQMEANVAAVFELLGIPFTGNSSSVLALCQDKFKTKAILSSFGLPTPRCEFVTSVEQEINLPFPLIVKPNNEDASLGIGRNSVVFSKEELENRVATILTNYEQPALVEEYIQGREFNIAIFDNPSPKALPVSEIDFSRMPEGTPHICSYEAKWYEDDILYLSSPPICPARIERSLKRELQQIALDAFNAMSCRDYARVDFRIAEDGSIYILEVNPNPDIGLNAGYARALAAAGIEYSRFWKSMIHNAIRRQPQ